MIPKPGRQDLSSLQSWHPIALLSVLGKRLEQIMARQIASTALIHEILSPQHCSVLPKWSTIDLVASFTHDVETALSWNQEVTMVTIDMMGVFNAVLKQ